VGGGSLLLNKPPSPIEVYNDIDGDLVNLFLVVRDHPKAFVNRLKGVPYSRSLFVKWLKEDPPKDPVERAARFYYVMRSSFSGSYDRGWSFSRSRRRPEADLFRSSLLRVEEVAQRLQSIYIDCLDFRRCIKNWDTPETLFYLDPPYYALDYYRHGFSEQDHLDLREILSKTKGRWLLTYNDHERIREMYAGHHIAEVVQKRYVSLVKATQRIPFTQLIITNYPTEEISG